jgi:predicted AAA+ superfamily ATPase
MHRDLESLLLVENPWIERPEVLDSWLHEKLPDPFVERRILAQRSDSWQQLGRAHLLIGPRQSGKSTTLWAHLARLDQPVLFLDCEQLLVRQWCHSAPLFLDDLRALSEEPVALFLEEAQHLENAGLFIKGIVDRRYGAPILVSGSSSFHLGDAIRESLAGRATRDVLLPFSLAEVTQQLKGRPEIVRRAHSREILDRHLRIGGYPEVWLSPNPERVLTELVEAIILRDASDLHPIGRPEAFRRLLGLAASQVGNLVNLAEWGSILGIARDTVASYLEILESGHVLRLLPPWAGGRRSELTRSQKVYFIDNGLRNRLVHSFAPIGERPDSGAVLENWVFTELIKAVPRGTGIHFWRSTSKAEVDFVVDTPGGPIGIEVKAGGAPRPSIPRSARSFIEAYEPSTFIMVSATIHESSKLGRTEILWVAPEDLATGVGGRLT